MKRTGRLTMVFTTCQVRASRLLVNLISFFSLLLFVFRLLQFVSPVVSLRHFRRTSPLPSLYVKLPSHRYIFRCVCVCVEFSVCVCVLRLRLCGVKCALSCVCVCVSLSLFHDIAECFATGQCGFKFLRIWQNMCQHLQENLCQRPRQNPVSVR